MAAEPEYRYIIGPGDTLNIVVWRNPELSSSVPVRPDGRITTPLVEDMVAQGKNP
ncbi:MAG TPA: polysaccharide biosynthesis/export family protein, partial [Zeimonas sp.]|nr:polysaccharide biosynthesis/export family protein [Zeimonas sp.]